MGWVQCYNDHLSMTYVPGERNRLDQDLRTASVAICRGLYEFGPCQCNLSQMFDLLACSETELTSRLYTGFNERELNETTRQSIYEQYTTVGYKGTGIETVNLICMLTNAELTALLTFETFDETTELPQPKPTNELYILLRSQLEDKEKCDALRNKWDEFKPYFPKVKDADDRLVKRNKMLTAGTGQNRINSSFRVSQEVQHQDMFRRMERWTMTFWALAPRTVTKYISFENQGRDSCKQTILPSEMLFKFCEARNKFIAWDTPHKRWARLSEAEQVK